MPSYCDISAITYSKITALDLSINSTVDASSNSISPTEAACYASYKLGKAREKLDASLADIHQPQNSKSATFDSNYQTTMLTGIVWAALGTTVLYYAFTKI
jgi:hypothetical protein